jgi:hypothetical protein
MWIKFDRKKNHGEDEIVKKILKMIPNKKIAIRRI